LSKTLGRRERKKLETRQRIVDCAVDLFAGGGYDSTTIEDIAECADVARATVFNYFSRKEDLVLAWFDRRRADLAKILAEGEKHASDTSSRLQQALRAIARLYDDNPRKGRAMVRAWLQAGGPLLTPESETSHLFANTIRSGQQQGDIRPDIDADRAGQVLFDAYLGVLYRWMNDEDGQFGFEENLLAMLDLLLAGIAGTTSAAP
jgi:AcrR family transcriptional regulator